MPDISNWVKDIAHVLTGVIVALSSLINWTLPLIGAGSFMLYELNEESHTSDQAYRDILEFMLGFFVAVIGLLIKEVLGW